MIEVTLHDFVLMHPFLYVPSTPLAKSMAKVTKVA